MRGFWWMFERLISIWVRKTKLFSDHLLFNVKQQKVVKISTKKQRWKGFENTKIRGEMQRSFEGKKSLRANRRIGVEHEASAALVYSIPKKNRLTYGTRPHSRANFYFRLMHIRSGLFCSVETEIKRETHKRSNFLGAVVFFIHFEKRWFLRTQMRREDEIQWKHFPRLCLTLWKRRMDFENFTRVCEKRDVK